MARDYQSIGEVLVTLKTEFPDVTISKIRFLEGEGLIDPERTASGYRKFRQEDVDRLRAGPVVRESFQRNRRGEPRYIAPHQRATHGLHQRQRPDVPVHREDFGEQKPGARCDHHENWVGDVRSAEHQGHEHGA